MFYYRHSLRMCSEQAIGSPRAGPLERGHGWRPPLSGCTVVTAGTYWPIPSLSELPVIDSIPLRVGCSWQACPNSPVAPSVRRDRIIAGAWVIHILASLTANSFGGELLSSSPLYPRHAAQSLAHRWANRKCLRTNGDASKT